MRLVIQRVQKASVEINAKIYSTIAYGLLVFVGIEDEDNKVDLDWLSSKLIQLRIFSDENGLMNLSIKDINGELLVVSQFTLFASTKKGNRPSFIKSSKPEFALPMYEKFVSACASKLEKPIQTGIFGADMKIELINDGPVTILIDSKNKE